MTEGSGFWKILQAACGIKCSSYLLPPKGKTQKSDRSSMFELSKRSLLFRLVQIYMRPQVVLRVEQIEGAIGPLNKKDHF